MKYDGNREIMDHSMVFDQNTPENGQFGSKSHKFGLKIEITRNYTGIHTKPDLFPF